MLDINEIKDIIPHRYPFLLVDRILEVEEGKRAVGIKNVSANEEFFNGHFPDYPVMPGVLIVEALAQVGAVAMLKKEENRGRLAFFAGIDNCRFKKQVKPGDQLRLEVEMTRLRGPIGRGKAVATVDGEIACEAEITFALGEKKEYVQNGWCHCGAGRFSRSVVFSKNIFGTIGKAKCVRPI